ncbi:MAG: NAD(P)-binding domain-containing protein [Proteobacteria bacterium]|nr:NAD(P)-binding domain-containing protein [Pseudomonadota bacterium]
MTLIVPAVLGGLAITVMALVSLAAARRSRNAAIPQQSALPRILIHSINDDRCTGCDACVAVCPTNVLDLMDNKSRVVRFQDCIQCEQCMWACPTEALVMHLEGTQPPPLKVPALDDAFQTAVPGQYLIGEVAGKPLVKNAANLGRMVVEHMLLNGMQPGVLAHAGDPGAVDVAIVGSGPGGLSAALTCIQRGLSYVVLEKEQIVASTVARYPKGKLVMAEPYDVRNVSLLPVFDSSKEQIVPIWQTLVERLGMQIRLGEAVEEVAPQGDGSFHIRTTVGAYRAQRVVLATGTRGKPRTLGVPGENMPKVHSLLDDPEEFRGRPVLVVGGGDSAVEAAIALADAGARVILSYRGRAFSRAAPKNKQTIESYEAQRRIKIRYQSAIVEFAPETVTLQVATGERKTYPNEAAFVLIGSDPPIKWLEKLGVHFVEQPHMYQLGKTDQLVVNLLGADVADCPEDAESAAALVQNLPLPAALPEQPGPPPPMPPPLPEAPDEAMSRPRRWLRSATAIFTQSQHKLDKPIPLSEFAKRARRKHTGHGRRDALDAAERTRVLRMLRDEGGRIADEESQIGIPAMESAPSFLDNDNPPEFLDAGPPAPAPHPSSSTMLPPASTMLPPASTMPPPASTMPPPAHFAAPTAPTSVLQPLQSPVKPDEAITPKPAVILGLDRAQASRRQNAPQAAPPRRRPNAAEGSGERRKPISPPSFTEEPTRQVDADSALAQLLRNQSRQPDNIAFESEQANAVTAAAAQNYRSDDDPTQTLASEEPTRTVNADELFRTGSRVPAEKPSAPDLPLEPIAESSADEIAAVGGLSSGSSNFESDPTQAIDIRGLSDEQQQRPRRKIRYPERREDSGRSVDLERFRGRAESLSDIDWDLD